MDLHTIEICAGVGMLGEGVRAGVETLGLSLRCIAYLEREAYPAACLASRIEERSLDAAPVWSDLLTFDASQWRGSVDGIIAGFPCQDLSISGLRAGLDGKRSGLFFNILDIADDCGAWFLVLENVAGIATATAAVMDEALGPLEERAAARILGELADRGWNAEWLTIPAAEVGAAHERPRWFCFAWRSQVANASGEGQQRGKQRGPLPHKRHGAKAHGPARQLCRPLFAPSPDSTEWAGILQQWPELAATLEPSFRGTLNGVAFAMDESRAQRIRCVGNGVVALQAAVAARALFERSGLIRAIHELSQESNP